MNTTKRIIAWAQKNERHLGAVVFILGFVTDLFTYTLLSISVVNLFFVAYLLICGVCMTGSYLFTTRITGSALWKRTLRVLFPLALQYAIGNILSGYLIFYTKSSVISVSWLFLLLLLAIFLGNELFRQYKEHLTFQSVLFFFTIYAYMIFELPILLHRIDSWVFIGSTVVSVVCFAAFLLLLKWIEPRRVMESLREIVAVSGILVILMVSAYFGRIVPPIPLTLPDSGIYHHLTHAGGNYVLQGEKQLPWWLFRETVVHEAPGEVLYAYSAVFAPVAFSATVVHVWQYYDSNAHTWITQSRILFPIGGGRNGGYRGYSEMTNLAPGKWRVSIETPTGLVIGRIAFSVVSVNEIPPLHTEVR